MTGFVGRVALVLTGALAAAALAGCSVQPSGWGMILGQAHEPVSAPSSSAPPPRPVEAPTETHQGKGNGSITLSWPADVAGYLTFDCPHCSSNVVVNTDGDEGLLINAIGAYHGTVWFNVSEDAKPSHTFTVSANSSWTATITDHRALPAVTAATPYEGKGDAVLKVPAGVTHGTFKTGSDGHSAVWVQGGGTMDLAVNQIGATTVTFDVPGPTLVAVEAYESKWTFTAS
jgi:hypothetical protein